MSTSVERRKIADRILAKLEGSQTELTKSWRDGRKIRFFSVDDLLPTKMAQRIFTSFPQPDQMMLKKSLREQKHVAAQMDRYDPILEDAIYAFQDSRVVELVSAITGLSALEPDVNLYAGGISLMQPGDFLNPHLDNSHDKDRKRYRVLNLLYYVTPEWPPEKGGNLEIWPDGLKAKPIEIWSRFNRLVVMETNQYSWHSVNPVVNPANRCCVSNYYFSVQPPAGVPYFHVTSFRARPGQRIRDLILKLDIKARMTIRKLFPKGIIENPHVYRK